MTESPDAGDTTATTLGGFLTEDVTTYTSDYSTGTHGWTGQNGSLVGNEDGVFGKDDVAKYTINTSTSSFHQIYRSGLMQEGKTFRVEADVYFPASNSHIDGLSFTKDSDVYATFSSQQTDQWITLSAEFTYTTASTVLGLRFRDGNSFTITDSAGDDVVYIHNIRVTQTKADAHVVTWYDQSGNSNDATQSTTASQPKIAEGGALLADGLKFDGVDDSFEALDSSSLSITGDMSHFIVIKPEALGGSGGNAHPIIAKYDTDNSREFEVRNEATNIRYLDSNNSVLFSNGIGVGTSSLISLFRESNASINLAEDGTLGTPVALTGTQSETSVSMQIGARRGLPPAWDGKISEIIIYNSDQSLNRQAIEKNIGDHYSITTP
ncbi:MAG: hypothetical protein ACPGII_10785, partial [Opitutales bacterium]